MRDLGRLVRALPAAAREELAMGPMLPDERHDCRVCFALEDLDHCAAVELCDYHDFNGTRGTGPGVYERCCQIYRAAGWTGEDDHRDRHGFEGDDS